MLGEKARTLLKCNLPGTPVTPYGGHLKDTLEQEGSGCAFVYLQVCGGHLCVYWCIALSICVFLRCMTECAYIMWV